MVTTRAAKPRRCLSRPGLAVLLVALLSAPVAGQDPPAADAAGRPTRQALQEGGFPWYDAATDAIHPVNLPPDRTPRPAAATGGGPGWGWWNWSWGEAIVFALYVLGLAALVVLVARYWKRFEPTARTGRVAEPEPATVGGGEVLPAALRPAAAGDDPWAEANRRRDAGDLAGAIVCLFAHQLLSLSRLGLVRLVPGRTGRQLHRAVADRDFQGLVLPTLRQFEAVYYGHRVVTPADFATVWAAAEAFECRLAEQGKR